MMENANTSGPAKAWFLCGVTSVGMLVFAGLYFLNPKTVERVQTVEQTQTVTNTLTKEVPITNTIERIVTNEVEKIVKVPAEIPLEYRTAIAMFAAISNATPVDAHQALFGMKDVQVVCFLDSAIVEVLSEDEVKAKFELTLRRNNVPISPNSANIVVVSFKGIWNPDKTLVAYACNYFVQESGWFMKNYEWHTRPVCIWRQADSFGMVGKLKANKGFLEDVEKAAEMFANDFLSANPKTK